MDVSIVIPTLNEAASIVDTLQRLRKVLAKDTVEIIIADGGSTDATLALATPLVDKVVNAAKGRARQMNAGANVATGRYLLFLHSDTFLPSIPLPFLSLTPAPLWGFYHLRLSGRLWCFRVIETMINWRSTLTSIATGDQCLFIRRDIFLSINGYEEIPLMEDVALSKRLRAQAKPWVVPTPVVTSSRRWETHGVINTVLTMWYLRVLYALGVSPEVLVKKYYG